MSLRVESTSQTDGGAWDEFVRRQAGWTPYHLHSWRGILEDVHGHECIYLQARDESDGLRGVLPLARVRSVLFGHFLVSMPFLNYGGPLGDPAAIRVLVDEAVRIAGESGADLLELRSPRELPLELAVSHRKITVLLDLLSDDPAELWNTLTSKVRSQVRRPIKEGVEVRFGPGERAGFYRVFARHMRDLGTPVLGPGLFARAHEEFGESMCYGCAYLAGLPVAAGCGFRWADRFELVWASALREYNRIAPNMLLYWRFLERCAEDGARVFDFGRCSPGSGTHRFKGQWGGRDHPLWWYQHGPRAGGGTPSPDSGPFSMAPKIWSRLPLAVANAVGPHIVRYIP